jgi:hypothetical protein
VSVAIAASGMMVFFLEGFEYRSSLAGSIMWLMWMFLACVPTPIALTEWLRIPERNDKSKPLIITLFRYISLKTYTRRDMYFLVGSLIAHLNNCHDPCCTVIRVADADSLKDMYASDLRHFFIKLLECAYAREAGSDNSDTCFVPLTKAMFLMDVLKNNSLAETEVLKARPTGVMYNVWQKMLQAQIIGTRVKLGTKGKQIKRANLEYNRGRFNSAILKSIKGLALMWTVVSSRESELPTLEELILDTVRRALKVRKLWTTFKLNRVMITHPFFVEYLRVLIGDEKMAAAYQSL